MRRSNQLASKTQLLSTFLRPSLINARPRLATVRPPTVSLHITRAETNIRTGTTPSCAKMSYMASPKGMPLSTCVLRATVVEKGLWKKKRQEALCVSTSIYAFWLPAWAIGLWAECTPSGNGLGILPPSCQTFGSLSSATPSYVEKRTFVANVVRNPTERAWRASWTETCNRLQLPLTSSTKRMPSAYTTVFPSYAPP